jgi:hypothetical protein
MEKFPRENKNERERHEDELVPEANAVESAIILAQVLSSYASPGVPVEELVKKDDYLRDAQALLASAELKDEAVKKVLRESIRLAKEG